MRKHFCVRGSSVNGNLFRFFENFTWAISRSALWNPCECLQVSSTQPVRSQVGCWSFEVQPTFHMYCRYNSHPDQCCFTPPHSIKPKKKEIRCCGYLLHFFKRQLSIVPRRPFRPFFPPMWIRTNFFHNFINYEIRKQNGINQNKA